MIRILIEQLTRNMSFRRKLPREFGNSSFCVSPSAGLRYLFKPMKKIDPALFEFSKEYIKKDDVVWDIGANIGLFTFCATYLSGKNGNIVALEPDAWLVQLLRKSVSLQPTSSAPVQIIVSAVAQSLEIRDFNIASRSRSANFLKGYGSSKATGGVAEKQKVVTVTLDWLAERLPIPNVIKIDVEGAELEVLRGGLNFLKEKHPIILCEVFSANSKEVADLLIEIGYKIYNGEIPKAERKELDVAPWCTIAIPMFN